MVLNVREKKDNALRLYQKSGKKISESEVKLHLRV